MPIRDDVVVVGGGLAGSIAALSAAEAGASVRLVSYKKSTLRFASGLIDVLGYPNGDGPVSNPYDALSSLPDDHPYSLAGEQAIRDGLDLFDEVTADSYRGSHTDANALVPTYGGTVKPTARYPEASAAGLASDARSMLVVGFRSLTDFDARLVSEHLEAAGVPFEVRGAELSFPEEFRADAKVTRFANALDRDEEIRFAGRSVGAREALAETVKPRLKGVERVGFPSLLGDEHADEVRADLESHLGVDVFEIPMGPPSFPGLRLENALFAALDDAGVRMSTGNPVVDYEADGDELQAVHVDQKRRKVPYHADEFVLATGGLVGKGIDSNRSRVREPIFESYVPHPSDRYDWFDTDAFGDHPFARFGVVVDDEMRVLDRNDAPQFANLRAAGAVVGGADGAAEKSSSGISLATGVVAGREAGASI
ncbi:glycerol-3-phosphate dehydrogenase subunit GlpB [Haloprofundus sp. MHR1]|uniref:glycerol-3-phosphate dehydrogenase subunit GlpB n=1 Tax=Haloprofundus sp. MHR1 TaxID=2572921 RepID=UPI0010BED2FA|nr:glycerol-3-phosphate dehydrogenase subunit GlpB [Haloprofundus sp. MHR1]QCJ48281.1 glycerol-3-phosphate dehydrogenase subunit GlpB [Haloprofundus sp. MHR1]